VVFSGLINSRYNNGNLESEEMQARWFGQPLGVSFSTKENPDDFRRDAAA
jgi:uncharacterized protein YhdP